MHVTIHIEEPSKRVLVVPDLVMLHPMCWLAGRPWSGDLACGDPLEDVVHNDHYDMSKYMSNEGIIEFLRERHGPTRSCYDVEPKRSE